LIERGEGLSVLSKGARKRLTAHLVTPKKKKRSGILRLWLAGTFDRGKKRRVAHLTLISQGGRGEKGKKKKTN